MTSSQLSPTLPTFGYQIVRVYPHDRDAFTQGLQFVDGVLYEGTGLNGRSSIRKVELDTGKVLQRRSVAADTRGAAARKRASATPARKRA